MENSTTDNGKLKEIFKQAIIEAMEEKKDLVHDLLVEAMEDQYGKKMEAALGSGYFVRMQLSQSASEQSLLAKYI